MFALALERRGKAQKLVLGNAVRREKIGDFRLACRDGTGLIEHNDLCAACLFKRGRRFEENAVFRADAAADHNGDRRGKPERARAADNEHRYAARERISECLPDEQPDDNGNGCDADFRITASLPSGSTPATTASTPAAEPMAAAVRALSPVSITTRRPMPLSSRIASAASLFITSATAITPRSSLFWEK